MIPCWSPLATAPLTGPADVEGLPESVKQATWFSTRYLFFVDFAVPLQPDMEQVDEDAMYAQLLKQPADNDNNKPSSGSKVHAKQNVLNVESTPPCLLIRCRLAGG